MRALITVLLLLTSVLSLQAATYDVTMEQKSDYFGWGKAYMVKNDLITIALVPDLGGRCMQYDLGTHPSIYIHEDAKGQLPASGDDMIGGFRQLPSPQADFGWPSPPAVDFGKYTPTVVTENADSVVILLESPVENSSDDKYTTHQGIQFKRKFTLYKASSRVKVDMVMLNKGTKPMTHGIWDITQSSCINNNKADIKNFWIYFKNGTIGGSKGYVQYMHEGTDTDEWKPDAVGGGIMSVQYLQQIGKIGSNCKAGWIAFTDQLDGYAYIKTFTYQDGKTYPDSGASVQVYTYKDFNMLEVEVLGPVVTLQPGDSTTLTENWFAARTSGPVIDVNSVGLTMTKSALVQTQDTVAPGKFGIFYPGTVKAQFTDATGNVVTTADSFAVKPTDSLILTGKKYAVPANSSIFQLQMVSTQGTVLGILDSLKVPVVSVAHDMISGTKRQTGLKVSQNRLTFSAPAGSPSEIALFALDGTLLMRRAVPENARTILNLSSLRHRTIVCRVLGNGVNSSQLIAVR